jgi:hypothetical protein
MGGDCGLFLCPFNIDAICGGIGFVACVPALAEIGSGDDLRRRRHDFVTATAGGGGFALGTAFGTDGFAAATTGGTDGFAVGTACCADDFAVGTACCASCFEAGRACGLDYFAAGTACGTDCFAVVPPCSVDGFYGGAMEIEWFLSVLTVMSSGRSWRRR